MNLSSCCRWLETCTAASLDTQHWHGVSLSSRSFITSLTGYPPVANLGLYLHVSADLAQLGPAHCWTLEIVVIQPLRIYAGMAIGQVSFWIPEGEKFFYEGLYAKVSTPLE